MFSFVKSLIWWQFSKSVIQVLNIIRLVLEAARVIEQLGVIETGSPTDAPKRIPVPRRKGSATLMTSEHLSVY